MKPAAIALAVIGVTLMLLSAQYDAAVGSGGGRVINIGLLSEKEQIGQIGLGLLCTGLIVYALALVRDAVNLVGDEIRGIAERQRRSASAPSPADWSTEVRRHDQRADPSQPHPYLPPWIVVGCTVTHPLHGAGTVREINNNRVLVDFGTDAQEVPALSLRRAPEIPSAHST